MLRATGSHDFTVGGITQNFANASFTNATGVPATPLSAFQNNSLGIGFSGSGFLIFYFTGVTAVLQSLGIINNTTCLAGSSGGAITAASICSDVPAAEQLAINLGLAQACRPTLACRGTLGTGVRQNVEAVLPQQTTDQCRKDLFVTVTLARPDNETDLPLVIGNFSSRQLLVDAVSASAYLPFWSGPNATTELGGMAVYDGGFSYPLPCPPGVTYCLRVQAQAPEQAALARSGESSLQILTANGNASNAAASSKYFPLNPEVIQAPPKSDIYPGLSSPLNITAGTWNSYGLVIPANGTLVYLYDQGRGDAAAWAEKNGLATVAQAQQALLQTNASAGKQLR